MIGLVIGCAAISLVFVILSLIGDAWERARRRHIGGKR